MDESSLYEPATDQTKTFEHAMDDCHELKSKGTLAPYGMMKVHGNNFAVVRIVCFTPQAHSRGYVYQRPQFEQLGRLMKFRDALHVVARLNGDYLNERAKHAS